MHYTFHSTQSWTMHGANGNAQKYKIKESPGPGNYDVKPIYKNYGAVSHTNDRRDTFNTNNKKVPGPGQYNLNSFTSDAAYSKRMGAKIPQPVPKQTPSPQDYNQDQSVIKKQYPNFSISTRCKSYDQLMQHKNAYKPAPTQYHPSDKLMNKTINTFMGTSNRKNLTETEQTPAPNNYQDYDKLDQKNKTAFKFGNQPKNKINKQSLVGPATYQNPSIFDNNIHQGRGMSFTSKHKNHLSPELIKTPGPGQYSLSLSHKPSVPAYSPGRVQRASIGKVTKIQKIIPGPGQYNPQSKYIFRSTSSSMFAKAARPNLYQNQKTPSPAAYAIQRKSLTKHTPEFSIPKEGTRGAHISSQRKPSPFQYVPQYTLTKQKVISHKLSNQNRHSFQKHRNNPGPGFYNLNGTDKGPKWQFSKDQRLKPHKLDSDALYDVSKPIADPPKYMNVRNKFSNQKIKKIKY